MVKVDKPKDYEEEYYKKAYGYISENPYYYYLRSRISFTRYFSIFHNITKLRILEYGCGLGQNIFMIKNNAVGYDSSKWAKKFCSGKKILFEDNFKKIKNKDFDIVLCSHTLEHVDNPLETLKEIKTKMKDDGTLVLVLPKEKHSKKSRLDMNNYHLYSWNFVTITNLLHRAGFNVRTTKEFRGAAYHKLMPLSKISFKLYKIMTSIFGSFRDPGELVIYASKIK